ncbi:MAG: trypsin-like peptidase domain-containing protein [Candidatus Niyogibacteria bacterium]|nr:trypsin-like peptidase domain-containing protein [Candidatus Niyogibacteria bacterium]
MADYQQQIKKAVKAALPAVVSIAVAKDMEEIASHLPHEFYHLRPEEQAIVRERLREAPRDESGRVKVGGGSGFIVDSAGIILTNKHVIADRQSVYTVITTDGKRHETKVLAVDPISDVAILKIDAKNLPAIKLGTAQGIELGETVVAIGNALGEFQNTISVGVVSGLSRLITAMTDMSGRGERLRGLIQTDAAINPGNSGGPLVNLEGEAVAINTAVVFGAQNIGFAIPIDRAAQDLKEIKEYGRIRRPFLGIRYMLLSPAVKERFNVPLDYGALIINEGAPFDAAVIPGSAAEKADLQEYDVILSCDKKKITEEETLEDIIASKTIGDTLEFEVMRFGKTFTKNVTLEDFNFQDSADKHAHDVARDIGDAGGESAHHEHFHP